MRCWGYFTQALRVVPRDPPRWPPLPFFASSLISVPRLLSHFLHSHHLLVALSHQPPSLLVLRRFLPLSSCSQGSSSLIYCLIMKRKLVTFETTFEGGHWREGDGGLGRAYQGRTEVASYSTSKVEGDGGVVPRCTRNSRGTECLIHRRTKSSQRRDLRREMPRSRPPLKASLTRWALILSGLPAPLLPPSLPPSLPVLSSTDLQVFACKPALDPSRS